MDVDNFQTLQEFLDKVVAYAKNNAPDIFRYDGGNFSVFRSEGLDTFRLVIDFNVSRIELMNSAIGNELRPDLTVVK